MEWLKSNWIGVVIILAALAFIATAPSYMRLVVVLFFAAFALAVWRISRPVPRS
jgi:hypothetical protein